MSTAVRCQAASICIFGCDHPLPCIRTSFVHLRMRLRPLICACSVGACVNFTCILIWRPNFQYYSSSERTGEFLIRHRQDKRTARLEAHSRFKELPSLRILLAFAGIASAVQLMMMMNFWNYGALLAAATWFLMLPQLGELVLILNWGASLLLAVLLLLLLCMLAVCFGHKFS